MKKLIAILAVTAIVNFSASAQQQPKPKEYKLVYDDKQINDLWRQLSEVQYYINNTNLPHQDVMLLGSKLDSAKASIYAQVRPQVVADTTAAKPAEPAKAASKKSKK